MSQARIDVDAYFRRIDFTGDSSPTMQTLRSLLLKHCCTIPFENLTPFMGDLVQLDLPALEDKLLHRGRGGYCFEQNLVLSDVLRQLGFTVGNLAARVRWNAPPDTVTPRSHMLLLVQLDGRRLIVDAGFGGMTLTVPLDLDVNDEQVTTHEPFRIQPLENGYSLTAKVAGQWGTLYHFNLEEQFPIDYEVSSFYLCRNPQSHFLHRLIAARVAIDKRHALSNNRYTIHQRDGESVRQELKDVDEILAVLTEVFGIRLPEPQRLREKIEARFDEWREEED